MGRGAALLGFCLLSGAMAANQPSDQPATTCDSFYLGTSDNLACAYFTFGCADLTDSMANFPTCFSGISQSPIHLTRADAVLLDVEVGQIVFTNYAYNASVVAMIQGYSLRFDILPTTGQDLPKISGGALGQNSYVLDHALIHWGSSGNGGSEHHLEGVQYPAELQLYHYNTKYSSYDDALGNGDGVAAVSFFYELPAESPAESTVEIPWSDILGGLGKSGVVQELATKISKMGLDMEVTRLESGSEGNVDLSLPSGGLLPVGGLASTDKYFFYSGSLTQPGNTTSNSTDCLEPVQWINYEKTIAISEIELGSLRTLLAVVNVEMALINPRAELSDPCVNNFRPIHALNPIVTSTGINRQNGEPRLLFYFNGVSTGPDIISPIIGGVAVAVACIAFPFLPFCEPITNLLNPPSGPSTIPRYQELPQNLDFLDTFPDTPNEVCSTDGICDPLIQELLQIEAINQAVIDLVNSQNLGYTAGVTNLFGESYSEVLAYRQGELPPSGNDINGEGTDKNKQATLDFLRTMEEKAKKRRRKREASREQHYEILTTAAKDQGQCSSCAAFAVTAAFETCVQREGTGFFEDLYIPWGPNPPKGLSQQNLLTCGFNFNGLAGCDGGQSFRYLEWLQGMDLETANSWPYVDGGKKWEVAENTSLQAGYTQRPGSYRCKHPARPTIAMGQLVASWDDHTERDIENILLDGHAVVTTLEITQEFQHYKNGIFYNERCDNWRLGPGRAFQWNQESKKTQNSYGYGYDQSSSGGLRPLRHAVVIVGFGEDDYGTQYWKVKNSWGPLWGEYGFFRILKGYGHCGIGAYIGVALCRECGKGGCDEPKRTANLQPPANLPQEEVFLGQTTFLSSPVAAQGQLTCASSQCRSTCPSERPCRVFCGPLCQRRGGARGTQCCKPLGGRGQRTYCPRRGTFCIQS